ncbi:MAG: autotransporter outer membrane beta-barrel domain-containing protein [Deltaproteobacteria bacterium]|nr:autotransporter outer membrane beta-barrel domain-containing protein [Deltaproteobacteria bacterium]
MTHRAFRNYASLIEVELAALADLGLEVDYKSHFGRSVYTNDNFIVGNDSYNLPGTAGYAIGIHLYGDKNRINQKSDITVNGEASAGIRSDGYLNKINIDSQTVISANGARSTGLLVAYGHDTSINNFGRIEALGSEGIAAAFDIGVNVVDQKNGQKDWEDGYGFYSQFSYFKIRNRDHWYWADYITNENGVIDEFEQAVELLNGPLVDKFNIKGSLNGAKAAIYIGGNSHVGEINLLGNQAEIIGPIITDYYYESDGRSTKLTFGRGYSEINANTEMSLFGTDPNFRFVIQNDILGYGAKVENGYLGRFSGRGLFDLELHGGQTTLKYDAKVRVNSFTMEPGASLLTTANFDKNLYPTITARNINLKTGSFVNLDQSFLDGSNILEKDKEYTVLKLDHTGWPMFSQFTNNSSDWDVCKTISVGVYDYYAYLYWDDKETLVIKPVSNPSINEEHSGTHAPESVSQIGAISSAQAQNSIFKHISETNPSTRKKSSYPPSSGENDHAWSLWLAPWYSYDRHSSQHGSSAFTVKTYGLTMGLEHLFQGSSPLVGLALSFGRPEAKSRFVNTKAKALAISGYFSTNLPYEFDISAILSYSFFNFDQTRRSGGIYYRADYDSRSWVATAELGRSFGLNEAFTLRPYGQVSYNHSKVDPYTESGNGLWAQSISKNTSDQWRTELGASVIWNGSDRLTLIGRVGWAHNFNNKYEHNGYFTASQPNQSFFKVETNPFDNNSVVYGLNTIISVSDSVDFKLTYDGSVSRNNVSHAGALTVVYNF